MFLQTQAVRLCYQQNSTILWSRPDIEDSTEWPDTPPSYECSPFLHEVPQNQAIRDRELARERVLEPAYPMGHEDNILTVGIPTEDTELFDCFVAGENTNVNVRDR